MAALQKADDSSAASSASDTDGTDKDPHTYSQQPEQSITYKTAVRCDARAAEQVTVKFEFLVAPGKEPVDYAPQSLHTLRYCEESDDDADNNSMRVYEAFTVSRKEQYFGISLSCTRDSPARDSKARIFVQIYFDGSTVPSDLYGS